MTDDKEERRRYATWTFEEYVIEQEKKEHTSRAMHRFHFEKFPLAPKHTDEEYEESQNTVKRLWKENQLQVERIREASAEILLKEARIKELEAKLNEVKFVLDEYVKLTIRNKELEVELSACGEARLIYAKASEAFRVRCIVLESEKKELLAEKRRWNK